MSEFNEMKVQIQLWSIFLYFMNYDINFVSEFNEMKATSWMEENDDNQCFISCRLIFRILDHMILLLIFLSVH